MAACNGQRDKNVFRAQGWRVGLTISAAPAIEMLVQSIKNAGHNGQAYAALLRDGIIGLFANLNGTGVEAELVLMSTLTLSDIRGPQIGRICRTPAVY
jgi:hypothetical protein